MNQSNNSTSNRKEKHSSSNNKHNSVFNRIFKDNYIGLRESDDLSIKDIILATEQEIRDYDKGARLARRITHNQKVQDKYIHKQLNKIPKELKIKYFRREYLINYPGYGFTYIIIGMLNKQDQINPPKVDRQNNGDKYMLYYLNYYVEKNEYDRIKEFDQEWKLLLYLAVNHRKYKIIEDDVSSYPCRVGYYNEIADCIVNKTLCTKKKEYFSIFMRLILPNVIVFIIDEYVFWFDMCIDFEYEYDSSD